MILNSIILYWIWNILWHWSGCFFFNSIFIKTIFCFCFWLFIFIKSSGHCCQFSFFFYIFNCFFIHDFFLVLSFLLLVSLWSLFFGYIYLVQIPIFFSWYFINLDLCITFSWNIGWNCFVWRKCILIFHMWHDICMWLIPLYFFCYLTSRRNRSIFHEVSLYGFIRYYGDIFYGGCWYSTMNVTLMIFFHFRMS